MSCNSEHRGITVGQEVGRCGRCTRVVLGLLGLIYIVAQVSQARLSFALIGQITGGAFLSMTLAPGAHAGTMLYFQSANLNPTFLI